MADTLEQAKTKMSNKHSKHLIRAFGIGMMLFLCAFVVSAYEKSDYLSPPLEINAGLFGGYAIHTIKNPSFLTTNYAFGTDIKAYQTKVSNGIKSYKLQEAVEWDEVVRYNVTTNCTYKQNIAANTTWSVDKCTSKEESYSIPHLEWKDVTEISLKSGEQKKIRYVFKWEKNAYKQPVKVDYVPELQTPSGTMLYSEYGWLDASCGKRKNISMTNIYGTQTINLTLLGNSTINPTTSNSNRNFTFADSSDTAQLNWFMDFVYNGSQQASQMLQFFVNISNNDSIWMYYDCNFPTTAETKITGNNSKVMTAYYNFDNGFQSWTIAGAGGSCNLVNDTTSNVSHGNQSGNQRLQMTTNAGGGNNCRTGGVGNNSNNALLNNFINIEWLGRIKTDAGSTNDGGALWSCGFASCAATNDISALNYETMLDYTAKTWRRLHAPTTVIHTFASSPLAFQRFKSIMNQTISSANVFSWVNGTPVTTRVDLMYTGYMGIQAIGMYGESGAVSEIDDVKIWVQNNATIPLISTTEENSTPPAPTTAFSVTTFLPANDTKYNGTRQHNINHTFIVIGNEAVYNATLYVNLSTGVPVAVATMNDVLNNTLYGINYTINNGSHEWYVSASFGSTSNGSNSKWYEVIPNFTVSAHDLFDNTGIQNFSFYMSRCELPAYCELWASNTTNYVLTTPYLASDTHLWNLTFENPTMSQYFAQTILNWNISQTHNASLYQAFVTVAATEKVSGQTISGGNYTANNSVTTQFNNTNLLLLKAGTYNITYRNSAYQTPITQQFAFAALYNATTTIVNLTKLTFNLTTNSLFNQSHLLTFNATITSNNWAFTEFQNTTTGLIQFNLINGSYNVTINAPYHIPNTYASWNISRNLTVNLSPAGVYILVKDLVQTVAINNFTLTAIINNSPPTTFITTTGNVSFNSDAGTKLLNLTSVGYANTSTNITIPAGQITYVTLNLSPYYTLNLLNETDGSSFANSGATAIVFRAYCNSTTIEQSISPASSTVIVPVNCPFTKLQMFVTFTNTTYFRTLMPNYNITNVSWYLINLNSKVAVQKIFYINDLAQQYSLGRLRVEKIVNNQQVLINEEKWDIEKKDIVYFILYDAYIFTLLDNAQSTKSLGYFYADTQSIHTITVPTIAFNPQQEIDDFQFGYLFNQPSSTVAGSVYMFYSALAGTTYSVNWLILNASNRSQVFINQTFTTQNGSMNYTPLVNGTIYLSQLTFNHSSYSVHLDQRIWNDLQNLLNENWAGFRDSVGFKKWASFIIIMAATLIFSGLSIAAGAATSGVLTAMFYGIGWLPLNGTLFIVLMVILVVTGIVAGAFRRGGG